MSVWAQIWPNEHPDGKVHKAVIRSLIEYIDDSTTFVHIVELVTLTIPNMDDMDILATARALRDKRDEIVDLAQNIQTALS